jgi:hypothetical protein
MDDGKPAKLCGFDQPSSGHEGRICNDCNGSTARLAKVAKNALLNRDFPRALSILESLSGQECEDRQGSIAAR